MAATEAAVHGANGVLYRATPDDLKRNAQGIAATEQGIMDEISHLRTYVVHMEEIWEGRASISFQNLMDRFDQCANGLTHVLGEISAALIKSADNYAHAEHTNTAMVTSVSDSMPPARLS